jgi:fatty-acyl-CoA synthase
VTEPPTIAAPGQIHICGPFIERTRQEPDGTFAIVVSRGGQRVLTNRLVLERALDIGAFLRNAGLTTGDMVVIVLEHCDDLYPAFLGCMIDGFVPAFLPPLTTKQDPEIFRRSMAALFARTLPAAVITSAASRDHVAVGAYTVILVEDIPLSGEPDCADNADRLLRKQPNGRIGAAFLQHSSGTTGLKKGVMLSHSTVMDQIRIYANSIGAKPGDVVASWLPLYHDMGLITSFLLPAVLGGTIVSLDALEWVVRPTILLDAMERYRAAFVWLPNFAFHHVLRSVREGQLWDLTATKAIVNCSEPCRAGAFEQFAARFADMGIDSTKLHVCYAMAENVFAVSQTDPSAFARRGETTASRLFLSCGRPIPGVEVEIHAADGGLAAPGEVGEIWIRSTTLFEGYFRQPDVTAARMRDGWFLTQDLGCVEAGELFVLGRVDDLLIVNGKNLFAHEIEDLLVGVAGIAPGRTLACADFDPKLGASRLIVLAEAMADNVEIKELEGAIRKIVFAQTGVFPSAVHFLPRGFLVKSTSGKIARVESYRKYKERVETRHA